MGALRGSDCWGAVLLRPDSDHGDCAGDLLRGGDDAVSAFPGYPYLRYPQFVQTLRDRVRDVAASLAETAGITIEHIARSHIRKEEVVARVLAQRGDHPGLVQIISAMEACDSYRPWHDKASGKTFVRPDSGKCLHYYFYFMDADLGLIYLRVPTWSPFRLQFYCTCPWALVPRDGHGWLTRQLAAEGIGYTMADNAFVRIPLGLRRHVGEDPLRALRQMPRAGRSRGQSHCLHRR